jgi:hypothetical protein
MTIIGDFTEAKKFSVSKVLKREHKSVETRLNGAKLVATCMKGLMESIPPDFCWK